MCHRSSKWRERPAKDPKAALQKRQKGALTVGDRSDVPMRTVREFREAHPGELLNKLSAVLPWLFLHLEVLGLRI